jgi:hypothetical protein
MRNQHLASTLVAMSCLAATSALAEDKPRLKTERFDRDPGWEGRNNWTRDAKPTQVVQDFGYSRTQHAGGKAAGEVGGRVMRSSRSASYGKPLDRVMTLDDSLHSSGRFVVTQTGGMSSLTFGWFNSETTSGSYPTNTLRIFFSGESGGCEVHLGYTTGDNQSDGVRVTGVGPRGAKVRDFNKIPVGTVYTYDLRYDPHGNEGSGRITFTLGGDGPYTAKDVVVNILPVSRKSGARFNRFGMINAKGEPGDTLAVYFDDVTLNGERLAFDEDPHWTGQNNRLTFDDTFKRGGHQFGYQPESHFAGGEPGEIGGVIFSDNAGFFGDDVGRLTLDDPLVATGRLALKERASEAGFYLGWFNSKERGYPPKNVIGVFAEGPNSVGSMFRPIYATSDAKIGTALKEAPVIDPFGKPGAWRIEYDPKGADGRGELRVSLDGKEAVLALDPAARKQNAVFDRFGIAIYEGGGQWSTVFLDDLEYTIGSAAGRKAQNSPH